MEMYVISRVIKDENFNFRCDLYLSEFRSSRRTCIQAEEAIIVAPTDEKDPAVIFMGILL